MTRQDVLNSYDVDANGTIRSLGKFEGEMLYVPFFFDVGMNGFADADENNVWFFVIEAKDRLEFPEIGEVYGISLEESDQGFVYSAEYDTQAAYDADLERISQLEAEDGALLLDVDALEQGTEEDSNE